MRAVSVKQASVLTAAVVALGAVALAPTVAASTASSGPGVWVQLSSGGGIANIVDPDVARFGKNLQVVWTQAAGTDYVLRTRIVGPGGAAASPIGNVLGASWASLDEFPAVLASGGQHMIVFSGLRSTNSSDPYVSGALYVTTSADGLTWSLSTGSMSQSNAAYGSYGSDATDAAGTPVAVFTAATANDISFHSGVSAANPADTPDATTSHNSACCAYYAGDAYDAKSGAVWTAWYSNSGTAATDGIDAERIYPTAGALVHAPKSTASLNGSQSSIPPLQRVQVVARSAVAGGGLWTAYGVGYPSQTKVALWHLGTSQPVLLAAGHEIAFPGVAAAPGGRLWLFWFNKGTETLSAVRTNRAATRLGRVCTVRTPHATTDVWKTAGDGGNGLLDLVVNAGDGSAEQISSTQVLPCLTGQVSPASVRSSTGGSVTITVTDAGAAMSGARVRYAGVTKTTNSLGHAAFHVAAHTAKGSHAITFAHSGYTGGKASFRVT